MITPKNKQPTNATERISKKIDVLFHRLIRQVSGLSVGVKLSSEKEIFSFENNPKIQKIITEILQNHAKKIIETINQETENQWLLSAQNNDLWVLPHLAKNGISAEKISHYTSRNWEALRAFQKRKTDGLGLSDRIWKYTDQLKTELEMGLDLGLQEGKSAQQISRDIRQYLHEPNVLFRRVRDTHGSLHLSKQAQKMGVGRGVYRSSYKNAMRVARTEVNMAYRASDMERYRGLDFVVGYEVRRSNHIFGCPVCEALKGKYPKDFIFLGWHPQCRCHTIPILEGGKITDVPDNFKEWVSGNQQRFENKKPLFLQQNQGYWRGETSKYDKRLFSSFGANQEQYNQSEAHKKALKVNAKIRPAETFCIDRYCDDFYKEINPYLRNGRKPPDDFFERYIKVMNGSFDKLPSYQGVVYRGSDLPPEVINKYKKSFEIGEFFTEKSYLSTSKERDKAFKGNTLYIIQSKNGKQIENISYFKNEKEVLFKNETKFKITDIYLENSRTIIHMKEI